jgi:hypothetical protein
MKCTINDKREITGFWEDQFAPTNSVDCDTGKPFHVTGTPENETYLYKLSDDGVVSPTDAGIAFETNQYQRDRAVAYDPISEQLDQIYHDMDGWKAKIKAVKDKYPKP